MSRFASEAAQVLDYWKSQPSQSSDLTDIFKQLQLSQEEAKAINEQRYKDILALYENLGKAGLTRIQKETAAAQAASKQSMISRGLGGTTMVEAAGRGIATESELQRQQLEENVALQRAGVMERRTDVGPDMSQYINLLQAIASGRGGGTTFTGFGPHAQAGQTGTGEKMGDWGMGKTAGANQPLTTPSKYTPPTGGGVGSGTSQTATTEPGGGAVYLGEKGFVVSGSTALQGAPVARIRNVRTGQEMIVNRSDLPKYGIGPGQVMSNWKELY